MSPSLFITGPSDDSHFSVRECLSTCVRPVSTRCISDLASPNSDLRKPKEVIDTTISNIFMHVVVCTWYSCLLTTRYIFVLAPQRNFSVTADKFVLMISQDAKPQAAAVHSSQRLSSPHDNSRADINVCSVRNSSLSSLKNEQINNKEVHKCNLFSMMSFLIKLNKFVSLSAGSSACFLTLRM